MLVNDEPELVRHNGCTFVSVKAVLERPHTDKAEFLRRVRTREIRVYRLPEVVEYEGRRPLYINIKDA